MGSTNHTSNYELSQFLGSDKPAWLLDYNGDMLKIDTQMKANADAASAAQSKADTADGKADDLRTDLTTLNNQVNDPTGLAADVATLSGTMNTVTSLIGNGEPTTTDKTLIGAINELNADIGDLSQLPTTNKDSVVASMGEIANNIGYRIKTLSYDISVTGDGVKTYDTLLTELRSAVSTYVGALSNNERAEVLTIVVGGIAGFASSDRSFYSNADTPTMQGASDNLSASQFVLHKLFIGDTNDLKSCFIGTTPTVSIQDRLSEVVVSGRTIRATLRVWTSVV